MIPPSKASLRTLSVDLVYDLTNSNRLVTRELRHFGETRLEAPMHRLRLVNKAVLVTPTPRPAFVVD
jgi:hypothetical protein